MSFQLRSLAVCSLTTILLACSVDTGGTNHDASACRDGHCDAATDGHGSTGMDSGAPNARDLDSVRITPANPTLSVPFGTHATQAMQVIGHRLDGTVTGALPGAWSVASIALGTIDSSNGTFTASGAAGGTVRVHVEVAGPTGMALIAETTLTVQLTGQILTDGTPADAPTHFTTPGTADATRSAGLVYPLAGAVMPQNVPPADIQWSRGTMGDIFRVTLHKSTAQIVGYALDTGPAFHLDWAVDPAAWSAMAQSSVDEPLTIAVDRWIAATSEVITEPSVSVRFIDGSVLGAIYYWDLGDGRTRRVNAATGAHDVFMPNPPPQPGTGARCVACHTVSQDGRYLSAELWGGGANSTVFDLTVDLTPDPAPTVFPTDAQSYLFSSFNPDSTRLVTNNGTALGMIDPRAGTSIAATGLTASGAAHPAWSPDGHSIAYIGSIDGTWAVDFTNGDLTVLPQTAPDAFGAATVLHSGASLASAPEGGSADTHPTWAPDSHLIAFAHGTHSRSNTRDGAGAEVVQPGALYAVQAAGGAAVRLNQANGSATETDSYWPTFAPFTTTAGGTTYFWLAFYSRRDYGNALAGTAGTRRRQLWVTAINPSAPAGTDPSSVPYWLPGQDTATENMAAYWAPSPCRHDGDACDVGSECCSGICADDGMGHEVCNPPPMSMCRMAGAPCGGTGCCAGLVCIANVCAAPPG